MLGIAEIMTTSPSPLIDPTTPKVPSISTEITIGTIIVLVFVIAFRLFLQLYSKRFSTTTNESSGLDPAGPPHPQGLDPATLDSLPVVEYNPKDFKDGLECFVCICEISQGEKTRILPKCNHGFHLECIDMWFYSHSTCPLCRIPVTFGENLVNVELQDHENEFATSGGNDHEVVVEIPSGGVDDEFCEDCLPSPKVEAAKTAMMWRLVSLKRLLSLGKRQSAKTKSYHRIAVVC